MLDALTLRRTKPRKHPTPAWFCNGYWPHSFNRDTWVLTVSHVVYATDRNVRQYDSFIWDSEAGGKVNAAAYCAAVKCMQGNDLVALLEGALLHVLTTVSASTQCAHAVLRLKVSKGHNSESW